MTGATLLTPQGRGAIAVVEVRGEGAVASVDACFLAANGRRLEEQPIGAIRFGRWRHERGEELVVTRCEADVVEVHCHGGAAAWRAIVESLSEQGCELVEEFSTPESLSPLAADAWRALSMASTERVAAVLLDQVEGALDRALNVAIESINRGDLQGAAAGVRALTERRVFSERLLTPWSVVLVGPPNVGKSSLINALVGYDRALVYDEPGVTRDVVSATTAIDGWPVTLSDTAGLRETEDPLESQGVELARQALRRADIVLLVHEATSSSNPRLVDIEQLAAGAVVLPVASKADLAGQGNTSHGEIATSVVGPPGIAPLVGAIESVLADAAPEPGAAVPYRPWHTEALERTSERLVAHDAEGAKTALQALLACERL